MKWRERRRACSSRAAFDESFEVAKMETERCCQHYRFDDRADLYCHLGHSAHKRIEKHHADAKVVGHGLPGDPPFTHTHDNFNVSCELGVLFQVQGRATFSGAHRSRKSRSRPFSGWARPRSRLSTVRRGNNL